MTSQKWSGLGLHPGIGLFIQYSYSHPLLSSKFFNGLPVSPSFLPSTLINRIWIHIIVFNNPVFQFNDPVSVTGNIFLVGNQDYSVPV